MTAHNKHQQIVHNAILAGAHTAEQIALATGMSALVVRTHITRLRGAGLIDRESRQGAKSLTHYVPAGRRCLLADMWPSKGRTWGDE